MSQKDKRFPKWEGALIVLAIAAVVAVYLWGPAFYVVLPGDDDRRGVEEPVVTLDFEVDRSSPTPVLVIEHEGRDPLTARTTSSVRVLVDEEVVAVWASKNDADDSKIDLERSDLNAGDRLELPITESSALGPGAEVSVVWTGTDGSTSTLGSFTVPRGVEYDTGVPGAELEFAVGTDGDYVVLQHVTGSAFNASNTAALKFEVVDGVSRTVEFGVNRSSFGAGDELVLRHDGVETGDVLRVTWVGPGGERVVIHEQQIVL